jgi:hypothetical protein
MSFVGAAGVRYGSHPTFLCQLSLLDDIAVFRFLAKKILKKNLKYKIILEYLGREAYFCYRTLFVRFLLFFLSCYFPSTFLVVLARRF